MVMPRAPHVHDMVTGGQDTVAIRVPAHPMAQQLLTAFGGGIAAPSANRYGRLSPTRAEHVREELGDAVRLLLDGGECQIGLESTIVVLRWPTVRLLRPGGVTAGQIREVVGELAAGAALESPRVPGAMPSHYAPATPMAIVPAGEIDAQAAAASRGGKRIAVLAQRLPLRSHKYVTWINAGRRPESYGHELYTNLRTLDKAGCRRILVQEVPEGERWDAIRDRLMRAASGVARSDEAAARWPCCRDVGRARLKLPPVPRTRLIDPFQPVDIRRLVREFGSPLVILDCERVRVQYRKLRKALPRRRPALRAETPAARGRGAHRHRGGRLPRSRDHR